MIKVSRLRLQRVHHTRIRLLNDRPVKQGRYVLYWMQQSQRAEFNHALEYAVEMANHYDLPPVVGFGLMKAYPDANLRHMTFLLEGLHDTRRRLAQRNIALVVRGGRPDTVALNLSREAAAVVCDGGYLRHQRAWRRSVARAADCRVVRVESDAVIPVEIVSSKAEYAARTIRPKIQRLLPDYLAPPEQMVVKRPSIELKLPGLTLNNPAGLATEYSADHGVGPVTTVFKGGTLQAQKRFARFMKQRLPRYAQNSNQPQTDDISGMSPYLHFGQISPLYLALEIQNADAGSAASAARYLEELIVRRELAINFVYYTPDYDRYSCLPAWARETLRQHRSDIRPHRYTLRELTAARTHDPYWNAAMDEMKHTGFMHNYMRMYWAKKILEWSSTPEAAFAATLKLNNRYFLDGRDPNSYAGVAWSYGLHDRPWAERPIFGKVRTMTASGLERKCDIRAYVAKIKARTRH